MRESAMSWSLCRVGLFACFLVWSGRAVAFSLSADQELEGGAVLDGNGVGNDITPSAISGGYLYNWADTNGPGPGAGGVATPGLDLLSFKIWNDNGEDIVLNLDGGDISGTGPVAFSTHRTGYVEGMPIQSGGDLFITNVGAISIGKIDTTSSANDAYPSADSRSGYLTIGEDTTAGRAGAIRIDSIDTRQTYGLNKEAASGWIRIYGRSHVKIETSSGTAGDILTWNPHGNAADVTIKHDGAFRVRDILAWTDSGWINQCGGHVTLLGDAAGDGPSGAFEAQTIQTSMRNTYWGTYAGHITIAGYAGVTVSNLLANNNSSQAGKPPGNITVTNIAGDIVIGGLVDANSGYTNSADGTVVFQTRPGSGGTIRLLSGLDCSLFKRASFDAASGKSFITGPLLNFAETNDVIRIAPKQRVYYDPKVPANAYLGGRTYWLLQPDGSPGGGALSGPPGGTVVILK